MNSKLKNWGGTQDSSLRSAPIGLLRLLELGEKSGEPLHVLELAQDAVGCLRIVPTRFLADRSRVVVQLAGQHGHAFGLCASEVLHKRHDTGYAVRLHC